MTELIHTKAVGVTSKNENGSRRQTIIRKYVSELSEIELKHEPDNKFSKNALAVFVWPDDTDILEPLQIGYIKDELAARLLEKKQNSWVVSAFVNRVTGGEDGNDFGVNLDILIESEEENKERIEKITKTDTPRISKTKIEDKKRFVNLSPDQISSKSKTTLLILWAIFGIFGGHHFYAGKKTLGFVYLFTGGLVLLGWGFDLLMILLNQYKDVNGKSIVNW